MKLRPASEDDVPALKTLLRRSWLTTWAPELAFETVRSWAASDEAGRYAQDTWRAFVVADADGAVRGMFHAENDHLHAIHLDPAHKRRGIGSALMDEAERRIARDHAQAHLEVLAFNTAAIAFYEQRGWVRGAARSIDECGEQVPGYEMTKTVRGERGCS